MKLLLGEQRGGEKGYTTVDLGGDADYIFDLNNPLTLFEENSIESIGAFHLIEHLRPTRVRAAVASWIRCLKPGGKLIIECPDFDAVLDWYLRERTLLSKQWIFGNDSREGQSHRWGFDKNELMDVVMSAPYLVDVYTNPYRVDAYFAEPQDYHKAQGPCLRVEVVKNEL